MVILIGIAFVGCSNDTIIDEAPEIDVTTETRHGYVKEVIQFEDDVYLKVDYADYLTGEEALKADRRDNGIRMLGDDTVNYVTNNYYISNINEKLRTFKLRKGIVIELVHTDIEVYALEERKKADVKQMNIYLSEQSINIFEIKAGVITGVEEQFLP